MSFTSAYFYLFLIVILMIYYILPIRFRWTILLLGSIVFYCFVSCKALPIMLLTVAFSYGISLFMKRIEENIIVKRLLLIIGILIIVIPLATIKYSGFWINELFSKQIRSFVIPMGISFYSLQLIGYLVDCYKGKIVIEKNPLKFALFATYFPQIIQGPIPRYQQLHTSLFEDHYFDEQEFSKGLHLIIWGFFLKFMIADKAAVFVNQVFDHYTGYAGLYVLIAGILYSIQLYTDFYACVCLAQGISKLFGIKIIDNFAHPYFAVSIKDFWRRWHISLSSWFRDYVYIPLGGNRKGKLRKNVNLLLTFLVSGIWHGASYQFLFWGFLHGIYQVTGEALLPLRKKVKCVLQIDRDSKLERHISQVITFLLVTFAWIIFRADGLTAGLHMILSIFTTWNPWILFNDSIFKLGLDIKESLVLVVSIYVLYRVSKLQEQTSISDSLLKRHLLVRWSVYIGAIVIIMIYGTYGFGFDKQAFIYGGF